MVTLNHQHEDPPQITNPPHQHAFTIVGNRVTFGVHMTQYHCEVHKYQLIFRFSLPPQAQEKLRELRELYPSDTFVLANAKKDQPPGTKEMSIPDLASGATPKFLGNVFQGIRPFTEEEEETPNFFPWALDRVEPCIAEVEVDVERIILFRPFAHDETRPPHPNFFIWGDEGEAHMTNIQTAALASGKFEPPAWGPDFDSVMSLPPGHPDWVDPGMVKAGIIASVPAIDMYDFETWPIGPLFPQGAPITFIYRGTEQVKSTPAGPTFLNASAVCNSPNIDPLKGKSFYMTEAPRKYWVKPHDDDRTDDDS